MNNPQNSLIVNTQDTNRMDFRQLSYFDINDSTSLINVVDDEIAKYLSHKKVSELIVLDEDEIRKKVKVSSTLNKLRYSFWFEYDRSVANNTKLITKNIVKGICSIEQFHRTLSNPESLAWICKPPSSYVKNMEESISFGMDRLREILDLPIEEEKWVKIGKEEYEKVKVTNHQNLSLIMKAIEILDSRVRDSMFKSVYEGAAKKMGGIPNRREDYLEVPSFSLDEELRNLKEELTKTKPITSFNNKEKSALTSKGFNVEPDVIEVNDKTFKEALLDLDDL